MADEAWAIGVDLGGTKIETALVDAAGAVREKIRRPTPVAAGAAGVRAAIGAMVREVRDKANGPVAGVGVGVAGQVERGTGVVRAAPNLRWHDEPFAARLSADVGMPVAVDNDVRIATWGEWLNGAGRGCDDLVCIFVGTGVGGGIVSGGRMLSGPANTAGELGHFPIDFNGPACHCNARGCLEAFAGGWAIARQAQAAIAGDAAGGATMLKIAGGRIEAVTGAVVGQAVRGGDHLAKQVMANVGRALAAGVTGIVNALNPARVILGGGVIEGSPELVDVVAAGVRESALSAAAAAVTVVRAALGNDAGVVGAAAYLRREVGSESARS